MTTRKLPRTTRTLTEDFDGSPFRVAYDRVERSYVVVSADDIEGMHHGYTGGDPAGYTRAYEQAAELNLEARAALADEQAEAERIAEYAGNSTAGLDGGADIDPDAVYCEVCGCGVTAEDAVLDGEQMVCCDCATPAPAPAEQADWTQALVLSGPLFEALCDAADAARAYWAHVPARLKVINDGWAFLLERNVIHCNRAGDLLYPSESTAGLVHVVGVSCSCTAGRWGQHCKHAAAADILGRARRLMSAQKAA